MRHVISRLQACLLVRPSSPSTSAVFSLATSKGQVTAVDALFGGEDGVISA